MRNLATIQKISNIQPIPNADSIEVATILGWKVVVKKGEFNIGDLVVYCEIDSLLPEKPEFEFLRKDKFRIRTVQLRGQVSQGICFPLSILSNMFDVNELKPGLNVTDVLGIVKYEPPIPTELAGEVVGAIPSFIQITDEDRIQILPEIPQKYSGEKFIASEKLDGSSTTYYYNNGHFGVCGRNWEFLESKTNSMWRFARKHDLENKLKYLNLNIALQGEIIGEGIQKNKYKIEGHTVRIFRIFDIDKYKYFTYEESVDIVNQLGIEMVPIIDWNYKLPDNVDEILEYANGKSLINPNVYREGVVFVKYGENYNGRLSFKAISNLFLLKNKE